LLNQYRAMLGIFARMYGPNAADLAAISPKAKPKDIGPV
jgi:hypothetical protein